MTASGLNGTILDTVNIFPNKYFRGERENDHVP